MAAIKIAERFAFTTFAPNHPYIAVGTMSGAVDPSFSSSANLDIFQLDFISDDPHLPLVGSCSTSDRFNRLAWSKPISGSDEFSLGLVAGGFSDGGIVVWNPKKLIEPETELELQTDASVGRFEKHTSPVRGLEFCTKSHALASGADEGAICVWDLQKPSEPILYPPLKSTGGCTQTDISFVSWNPKHSHILASTSNNGVTVIWDLKKVKPAASITAAPRKRCSVLQWDPDNFAKLITASDDDNYPSLQVWDLRNMRSPELEIVGHSKGVIAVSWCPYDRTKLLTSAKDNRTICWDVDSGEIVCELPSNTNGNFDIHWYAKIPGVISASSFDAKVGIYNIQACDRLAVDEHEINSTARLKAPNWMKRPVGAKFGFGGKLVTFQNALTSAGAQSNNSEVYVHALVTEQSLVCRSTEFESVIKDGERSSLLLLCERKYRDAMSKDELETWGLLKVLFEEDGTARTKLLSYLGFRVPNKEDEHANNEVGGKLTNSSSLGNKYGKPVIFSSEEHSALADDAEEFFENLQLSENNLVDENMVTNTVELKKQSEESETTKSSIDEIVQRALVVGDHKGAVLQCIKADKMADALVIATISDQSLLEFTRDWYLKHSVSPYKKIVSALASNDLLSLINASPTNSWKESLALLCTYAQSEEWTMLCNSLASRLMTVGNTLAAALCYICAGNIDKTVEIWATSLNAESGLKTYIDILQDLMEKTVVLMHATGEKILSASLSKLVENYVELLASQGLLTTAMHYLKLLNSEISSHKLAIFSNHISISAAGKETEKTYTNDISLQKSDYVNADCAKRATANSHLYYQVFEDQVNSQENYNRYGTTASYGQFQHMQNSVQQRQYPSSTSFQPAESGLVIPQPHLLQASSNAAPVQAQPTIKPFIPAIPRIVRNLKNFLQPNPESQLYTETNIEEPPEPAHTVAPYNGGYMAVPNPSYMQQQSSFPQPTHGISVRQLEPTATNNNEFVPVISGAHKAVPNSGFMQQHQSSFPQPTHSIAVSELGPTTTNSSGFKPSTNGGFMQQQQQSSLRPQLTHCINVSHLGPTTSNNAGFAPSVDPVLMQPWFPEPTVGASVPQMGVMGTNNGSFIPMTNPSFMQRPCVNPIQASTPTHSAKPQLAARSMPPPTIQTVDISNVPAGLKPVIETLTKLYLYSSKVLGGSEANAVKKREIDDNSHKIGALFAKLNSGDISSNAAEKLTHLCRALDEEDFGAALHIQVGLTTSDWDECNFWLAALKRMIKTVQKAKIQHRELEY